MECSKHFGMHWDKHKCIIFSICRLSAVRITGEKAMSQGCCNTCGHLWTTDWVRILYGKKWTTMLLFIVADVVFSDGKVSSYLHVGNIVYTVWRHTAVLSWHDLHRVLYFILFLLFCTLCNCDIVMSARAICDYSSVVTARVLCDYDIVMSAVLT